MNINIFLFLIVMLSVCEYKVLGTSNETRSILISHTVSLLKGNKSLTANYSCSDLQIENSTNMCCAVVSNFSYVLLRNKRKITIFETLIMWQRIISGLLTPLISMFGITANILNCLVFYQHGLRQRVNLLLFSHSCTDLAYSVYIFISYCDNFYLLIIGQHNNDGPIGTFVANNGLHTFYGFNYASAFLSSVIASDRCLCVVRPFSAQKLLSTKHLAAIVCVGTSLLVCVHYVAAERYKIICAFDPLLEMEVYQHVPSDFYIKNTLIVNIITGTLYGLGLPLIFLAVTVIATIITVIYLKSAAEWRLKAMKEHTTPKEVFVTKMLIATSCLFIACSSPDIVLRLTPLLLPDFRQGGRLQNGFTTCVYVITLIAAVHSCLNICIYFKMGSRYRATLAYTFGSKSWCICGSGCGCGNLYQHKK